MSRGHYQQGDLMTDHYHRSEFAKGLLTIIALCLIWLGVKDMPLEPVVSAQSATWEEQFQNWDENAQASGLPNSNFALLNTTGTAHVCSSRLTIGGSPTMWPGDYGSLWVLFKTEKHCGGSTIGSGRMFSKGAGHPNMPSSDVYLLSEAQLMTYAQMTQRAAAYGQEVWYVSCGPSCLTTISFREIG